MKKVFLLTFISNFQSSSLLSQDIQYPTLKGAIIFRAADYNGRTIPQDVLWVPHDFVDSLAFEENVSKFWKGNGKVGYEVYFQAMRWTQSDLEDVIKKAEFFNVRLKHLVPPRMSYFSTGDTCKVIFGTIVFERKPNVKMEELDKIELYRVSVEWGQHEKIIDYSYCPRELGFPKKFILSQARVKEKSKND